MSKRNKKIIKKEREREGELDKIKESTRKGRRGKNVVRVILVYFLFYFFHVA